MYFLARRFPMLLVYFCYSRTFLSGKQGQIDNVCLCPQGERDRALMEDPIYEDFWQRDVEESVRQGTAKPYEEEDVLRVWNWGFRLANLKLQKQLRGKNILSLLKSFLIRYRDFLGPMHIWQGMDHRVVPPSMTDFVPSGFYQELLCISYHIKVTSHFFNFCDECQRKIFHNPFWNPTRSTQHYHNSSRSNSY